MMLKQIIYRIPLYRPVIFSIRSSLCVEKSLQPHNRILEHRRPCTVCGLKTWSRSYATKKQEKIVARLMKPKEAPVGIWKGMTVAELAKATHRNVDDIFEAMLYVDDCDHYDKEKSVIDRIGVIQEILKRLGKRYTIVSNPKIRPAEVVSKDATRRPPPDPSQLVKRPPVVTIMGHVDHGKTTLLDTLRHSSIVSREFGGITQHIGAFSVKVTRDETICFLDTPGHAAFSAMRARGANATDIVILVVAADDGVMEQTVESIKYALAAKVPVIVAINKMDKATADPERVKNELVQHGIQVEDKGGDVQAIPISAKLGDNLEHLVESILALAEMLNVKGDPKGLVEGVIIEASVDSRRGKLATVLVQRGTLRRGDVVVGGSTWAKVRAMFDENGQTLSSATPGTPVQVVGWRDNIPSAGDIVLQVETESRANEVMKWRHEQQQERKALASLPVIQQREEKHNAVYKEKLKERLAEGKYRYSTMGKVRTKINVDENSTPGCYVVVKGDVDGSVEAILDIMETYNDNKKCRLELVHYGVGKITPADLDLAEIFKATVYAFNVGVSSEATGRVKSKDYNIKHFNVIYKLFDDMKELINSKILPVDTEEIIGEAEVLQEFKVSDRKKKVPVAGCCCTKGLLKKSEKFRVLRNGEVIHEGPVVSMYHLKNEVDCIKRDVECGLRFSDKELNFLPGDLVQCYHLVPMQQFTDWDPGF